MNKIAGDGEVFVCLACGKKSKDMYGTQKIHRSWDESCMLNCVLALEEKLITDEHGYVKNILEGGILEKDTPKSILPKIRLPDWYPRPDV